jgi:cytochrome c553
MKTLIAILSLTLMLNAASDSAALFKKCSACHGLNAEKSALGKSEIIAGWKADKTITALNDYKAGTRNTKGMGAIMKSQVAPLSDKEIKSLSVYIASLKK